MYATLGRDLPRSSRPTSAAGGRVAQLRSIEAGSGDGEVAFGRGIALHVSSLGKEYFMKGRGREPRIVGGDLGTLLYTVQIGSIEVHPRLSRFMLIARAVVAPRPCRATVQRPLKARPPGTIYVDAIFDDDDAGAACARG